MHNFSAAGNIQSRSRAAHAYKPKREKSEPKKSAQDSANLAPATIEQYYFTSQF